MRGGKPGRGSLLCKRPLFVIGALLLGSVVQAGEKSYRIETFRPDIPYGPIPALRPVGMSLEDGLMLKEGEPHFWIGQGDGAAASQQGVAGIWLAWLQGVDALTLNHGMSTSVADDTNGIAVVSSRTDVGIQTWRREAVRLGLFTDFFHNWHHSAKRGSDFSAAAEKHPDLAEVVHNYGHYMGCDAGYADGVDILVNRHAAVAEYLRREPDTGYMELCREPGPEPHNRRAYEGFRAFAQKKYGSIEEASRVWRIPYKSWEEVVPPHLDRARWKFSGSVAVYLRRLYVRREHPEIYWDWIAWMQQDLAKSVGDEIAALHRRTPEVKFTIDVRGHTSRHDSYAAFVPELVDGKEDLFSIHNTTHAYYYGGKPYDAASVTDSTTFPFLGMGYFRANTKGAIVNSEDIVSVARAPNADEERMRENCLGQLVSGPWKFCTDPSDEGVRNRYWRADVDDAAWADITVPGMWDTDPRFQGYGGVVWYRKTFDVKGAYKFDHEDGSRIFQLIGKGVAQEGTVWLNGHKLGDVCGWSKPYSFDVGNYLVYGGRNVLVWRVDGCGKSQNGLRFASYILANDMLSNPKAFDERQFRHLVFTQLFEGLSGVWVWHWHPDGLRAYQPALNAQAQTVAAVALPYVRHRRGKVAYLYPFRNQPGLPAAHESTHGGYLDFACAAEFLGQKPDVFGELAFRREATPERYAALLVPYAHFVEDETYAHFKRYVEAGGTAIVTDGSLERTFSRYAETDIRTYAGIDQAAGGAVHEVRRGKGRVVYVPGRPPMDDLFPLLSPYLPAPDVAVTSETRGERPLIERVLVGSETRKTLYLCNWGGLDHALTVTLPDGAGTWDVTSVVGSFEKGADGTLKVTAPASDVVVAILDRPGSERVRVRKPSPLRQEKYRELQSMLGRFVAPEKSDVLFMLNTRDRGGFHMGAAILPEYVRAAESLGLTCAQSDPTTWTPELLKGRKLLVLGEFNSNVFVKNGAKKSFWAMVDDYLKSGGSALVVSSQAGTTNVDGLMLRGADRFGATVPGGTPQARVSKDPVFGDPYQYHGVANAADPICEEVRRLLVGNGRTMEFSKGFKRANGQRPEAMRPLVTVPDDADVGAGRMVVAATRVGEGKTVCCADALMFQPFRIEHDDNANLLVNIVGWLADKPVDTAIRKKFRERLYLTEADLLRIAADER